MNLRAALLRIASENPSMRIHLLPLLSRVAAEDKWISFLKAKYEGGKKKVPNPNPKTRKKHPEVSVSTALKDEGFYKKIRVEFESWSAESTPAPRPSSNGTPAKYQTQKEFKEFSNKWAFDKFSKEENTALRSYAGYSYYDINTHYRKGDPDKDTVSARYGKVLDVLDAAFVNESARVPVDVEVLRGIDRDHPLYSLFKNKTLQEGMEISDRGYLSTSINQKHTWGSVKIRISVPKGTPAIYLGDEIAVFPKERELLLNRGTRIRITRLTEKEIHAEVISQ